MKPVANSSSDGPAAKALRAHLAAAGGSVPFEEWMRWALYDGEHGYYTRRVRTVGREGDFSTAATLGTVLADAVAAWAAHHREDGMGADGRWHLIELGGGSGALAARVLGSLGWWARRRVRYHVVEVSEGLRTAQRAALARWGARVSWHGTLADALAAAGGAGLIFSNEFVDAFPCARWVWREGWREVRVAWPDGADRPGEVVGGAVGAEERAATSVGGEEFARAAWPGQVVEVFASYRAWLREQFAGWRRGRLLTIDYGDEVAALYARRPAGTLRAYCRQLRFTGAEVYARIGQQDLTADVNFTDLWRWGEALGLRPAGLRTQADFLRGWLRPATLARASRDVRGAALLDPEGAGGAFKVLEQVREAGRDGGQIAA